MTEIAVNKARHEHRDLLAEAFADAFADDPIFSWLLEAKPHRDQRLTRLFRRLLNEELRQSDHEVYVSDDGSGGAIWKGIDRWKTPPSSILRQAPSMALAFGPGNARPWKIFGVMEKVHPREPHYYLETLGTKQAVQGKGVGTAVMSVILERCDREGVPAYLESSNPRNIPLYARHGFEVRDPVPLPSGAPVLTPMWREPPPSRRDRLGSRDHLDRRVQHHSGDRYRPSVNEELPANPIGASRDGRHHNADGAHDGYCRYHGHLRIVAQPFVLGPRPGSGGDQEIQVSPFTSVQGLEVAENPTPELIGIPTFRLEGDLGTSRGPGGLDDERQPVRGRRLPSARHPTWSHPTGDLGERGGSGASWNRTSDLSIISAAL